MPLDPSESNSPIQLSDSTEKRQPLPLSEEEPVVVMRLPEPEGTAYRFILLPEGAQHDAITDAMREMLAEMQVPQNENFFRIKLLPEGVEFSPEQTKKIQDDIAETLARRGSSFRIGLLLEGLQLIPEQTKKIQCAVAEMLTQRRLQDDKKKVQEEMLAQASAHDAVDSDPSQTGESISSAQLSGNTPVPPSKDNPVVVVRSLDEGWDTYKFEVLPKGVEFDAAQTAKIDDGFKKLIKLLASREPSPTLPKPPAQQIVTVPGRFFAGSPESQRAADSQLEEQPDGAIARATQRRLSK